MYELRIRHGDASAIFTPAAGAAALLASQLQSEVSLACFSDGSAVCKRLQVRNGYIHLSFVCLVQE